MRSRLSRYLVGAVGTEISRLSRYYDRFVQVLPLPHDDGALLESVVGAEKGTFGSVADLPDFSDERARRSAVLLNGVLNQHFDLEGLLRELRPKLSRTSRIVAVAYNSYMRWPYELASSLGLRTGEVPEVFLTRSELENIADLAGFDIVRMRPVTYAPLAFFGIGSLVNYVLPMIPGLRWTSVATVIVFRPRIVETGYPSVSVIVPARNEAGNIPGAIRRLPDFGGAKVEVVFVEGGSTDRTWDEILEARKLERPGLAIKAFRQTGKGKNDAVKLGVEKASHELVMILDADLTMPPELLGRYYEAYRDGKADFVNGSRLVYPIEGREMKFINLLGNLFFSRFLSGVLETRLSDTLCGTKLLARHDWERIRKWNEDFGRFDPFGDFELLFAAASLGLGVVNLPVRYLARTYGTTNILRFRHGLQLLRMAAIGLFRIRAGNLRERRE
ncbi:MAG: glycosyltransferase family 2 protein [Bdellovibrionales bacterium]|nr:glycosyltransferase family 2 protein [Bdellovibrionales bacterium]